jgi:hypothetical protein
MEMALRNEGERREATCDHERQTAADGGTSNKMRQSGRATQNIELTSQRSKPRADADEDA